MKNKNVKNKRLYKESKRLFLESFNHYLKYWVILFLFGIGLILLFFYLAPTYFEYISWAVVIINIFVTSLYLVVFDGIPARKIKKDNFTTSGMNKEKGIVFYNALKLRTIFRGLLNTLGSAISIALAITLIII